MALPIQFDLFEKNDEMSLIRKEFEETRKMADNVRKGLFARQNEFMKLYMKQEERLNRIEQLLIK